MTVELMTLIGNDGSISLQFGFSFTDPVFSGLPKLKG
jgi:hypothetical protein